MRELERTETDTTGTADAQPRLAVIGAGKMGRSVVHAAAGTEISTSLSGRREALAVCEQAGAALLCVPDDEIAAACETVSAAVPPLRFVGHTSGATGLDMLEPATRCGARAFSIHPLQTVPDGGPHLAGAAAAVSGSDAAATRYATALAEALGMRPFPLPERHRAAYHAAASIACNYLVALEETAVELLERTGVENPRELLAPLVLRTAANWAERGPEALTGPVARGDTETVERHLEAIDELAPELRDTYAALAERTRAIAAQQVAG